MKDPLVQTLLRFLKKHRKNNENLLLGFSGGPDSLALFYLLLECQKALPFTFAAAHIDHGWRPESSDEAQQLEQIAKKHRVPFFSKRLAPDTPQANQEAAAREARIDFFKELCNTHGFHRVLLAHHQDDSAETVLKKIFEGSSLSSCHGIAPSTHINGLPIWRPLLETNKKMLLSWLEKRGHQPFFDQTNLDPKYLRARMRTSLIPHIEHLFGKNITRMLSWIGTEAQELQDFMKHHLADILAQATLYNDEIFIDLSPYEQLSLFEIKFIVRYVCLEKGCCPSKEIIADVAQKLADRATKKSFNVQNCDLVADKGRFSVSVGLENKRFCNII